VKLKKLFSGLSDIRWRGNKEIDITGLCNDSKRIVLGNLFLAKRGKKFDGTKFIPEAVAGGARAILTDLYDPFLDKEIVQILHEDVSSLEPLLAARYYDNPSQELFLIGVTGTSGKTTTSYLIHHLLEALQVRCGLMGTNEVFTGKMRYASSMTTFDVLTNQKLLKEMVREGCKACVMEVSSHGLDQGRVGKIAFDCALFTNLSHEHLDYHPTKEHYFSSKQKLFSSLEPKKNGRPTFALLNADSPYSQRLKETRASRILSYGIDHEADLQACDICFSSKETNVCLCYQKEKELFSLPLIGRYNVYNLLAAVSVGLALGKELSTMKNLFSSLPQIPGRLELVSQKNPFSVFVDYAHKEEALREVLLCLREIAKARIITLFGCGGDRDREKRARMAKVAEELSDFVVVTSDNPRSEDPKKIIDEILVGFSSNRYLVEEDRKRAIEKVLKLAKSEDLVLIAGRGHETAQIIGSRREEFDDRKVAKEICDAL
jgi:UDP-N-acetylmuramoyl-L-alanyl-D-glutamate--2,6-diaminopimelate ligase